MKFLEIDRLAQLTAQLTEATICERVINGRIEAFTMKRAGTDKKYAHALGETYKNEILAEETEFSNLQRMQRNRSASVESSQGAINFNSNSNSISDNHNIRKMTCPPSPKTKRVRIETPDMNKKRERSNSLGSSTIGRLPTLPTSALKASAMRARSDSFLRVRSNSADVNTKNIVTNFPYSNSPLGDFHDTSTQRLMTDLILTLNASFPDYDFTSTRPSHFSHVPSSTVAMNRTNERLSELAACTPQGDTFLPQLWNAIDDVIDLNESEIYSYVPPSRDDDDDPLSFLADSLDGTDSAMPLWTFNFFFVNKALKRIVLITCVQTMRTEVGVDNDDDDDDSVVKEAETADFGSPGRILRTGSSRFDGNTMDDEDGGGVDYDMEDGMNQAVSPPATMA
mmetsp:Transcript_24167/g.35824  ORF Transcript_24167/g.35824 Transcript_24167/m.35824 type:complete len:396 (+) Transcript_24167:259-1446(+)